MFIFASNKIHLKTFLATIFASLHFYSLAVKFFITKNNTEQYYSYTDESLDCEIFH